MKIKEKLKYSEVVFKNETLKDTVILLINNGFNVYSSKGTSYKSDKITYIYYEKDNNLAYLQADRMYGIKYSTVHKSDRNSGFGTGFGLLESPIFNPTIEELEKGFLFAPYWAKGNLSKIRKYKGINDYLNNPTNRILTMYQIIK